LTSAGVISGPMMVLWSCGSPGQRLAARDEFGEEFVRDLPLNDDPARVEANLPLMEERAERRSEVAPVL
jgi:hypothetical protein